MKSLFSFLVLASSVIADKHTQLCLRPAASHLKQDRALSSASEDVLELFKPTKNISLNFLETRDSSTIHTVDIQLENGSYVDWEKFENVLQINVSICTPPRGDDLTQLTFAFQFREHFEIAKKMWNSWNKTTADVTLVGEDASCYAGPHDRSFYK